MPLSLIDKMDLTTVSLQFTLIVSLLALLMFLWAPTLKTLGMKSFDIHFFLKCLNTCMSSLMHRFVC